MKELSQFVAGLRIGEPVEFSRLRILPVFVDEDRKLPFLDLEEALRKGFIEITEISEGGSVPDLEVSNTSSEDVIILDGEELIGAKQNRIVNTTIVVGATTKVRIPVSCVEQRRWRYTSASFAPSKSVAYSSLRRMKYEHVTASLRRDRSYSTDQSAVWREVDAKMERMAVTSPSAAMSDMYESTIDRTDDDLQKSIPHREKQVGFLAFIGGNFAGGELFGSAELCGKKMPKLVRSYYLDSLDAGVEFPAITVEQIFAQMQAAQHEQFEAIGKGAELRFETANIQGSWKLVDDLIPHVIVFPRGSRN
jgi:hypothetical protein